LEPFLCRLIRIRDRTYPDETLFLPFHLDPQDIRDIHLGLKEPAPFSFLMEG
jgi:hypothetical protein